MVSAVVFRYEIEIWHCSRMECSFQRGESGVTNRSRRQGRNAIGIVRAQRIQIFPGQIAVKVFETVDNRRVALQGHFQLEPVVKYGQHQWSLGLDAGFLFNH